jgi:hypothetical protein
LSVARICPSAFLSPPHSLFLTDCHTSCDLEQGHGKIYAVLEGIKESTCANILKKSSEWSVITALICAKIELSNLPVGTQSSICKAIKETSNWSQLNGSLLKGLRGEGGTGTGTSAGEGTTSNVGMERFATAQKICDGVKQGFFEGAVPTGYKVPGDSCKIPTLQSQLLGSCFITFPDLHDKDAYAEKTIQTEIWRRITTLQTKLGFPKYDSPYLMFRTDQGHRRACTLDRTWLG